jgi:hypothetical protein
VAICKIPVGEGSVSSDTLVLQGWRGKVLVVNRARDDGLAKSAEHGDAVAVLGLHAGGCSVKKLPEVQIIEVPSHSG